jgi:hypothetical protein
MKKLLQILRNDEGLSLSEVMIAIGLSGLIALGCTQMALASFSSAKYVETKALNTVSTASLNHYIVSDIETASSLVVHGSDASFSCTSKFVSGTVSNSVKPLFTINQANGSSVGYEVRDLNSEGSIWRVECPTGSVQNGSSMMLRRGLPGIDSALWSNSVKCVTYPAGGTLQTNSCPVNQVLDSINLYPGLQITVPATVKSSSTQYPSQVVLAARNVA